MPNDDQENRSIPATSNSRSQIRKAGFAERDGHQQSLTASGSQQFFASSDALRTPLAAQSKKQIL